MTAPTSSTASCYIASTYDCCESSEPVSACSYSHSEPQADQQQTTRRTSRKHHCNHEKTHQATNSRASSSSETIFPVCRRSPTNASLRRMNFTFLILASFLFHLMISAALVDSATFFYGATQHAEQPGKSSGSSKNGLSSELSRFGSGSSGKLSEDDLKSVYNFCNLLPLLESAGQVQKNNQSKEICAKLVTMLEPMFKRKNLPEEEEDQVVRKRRRDAFFAL